MPLAKEVEAEEEVVGISDAIIGDSRDSAMGCTCRSVKGEVKAGYEKNKTSVLAGRLTSESPQRRQA